ncbi:hypothetical protein IEO21_04520 [Rhodonia placenta]|uniref:Cytochrome P450 n=1 Tax=Rhodonia placenta TaxID=104341 RepID=A0A8H7P3I9_9APHY|nr:hypothetical protein IEO21_04520 [Postia placenta]
MLSSHLFLISIAALTLLILLGRALAYGRSKRLPPGPPGWPIVGNILDMPVVYPWKTFTAWGEQWGDIIYIKLFGQSMLILNNSGVASELLDKRSNLYSDRPHMTMSGELMGWKRTAGFQSLGPRLRGMRRLMSTAIGSYAHIRDLSHHIEDEVQYFLARLLQHPESLTQQIRRTTGSIILKIAYGYQVEADDDKLLGTVERAMEEFTVLAKLATRGWVEKKGPHSTGTVTSSFTSTLLEAKPDSHGELLIKDAAASLYGGESLRTHSSVYTFFLAMTCFPEVQRKAQRELDSVVGRNRLPVLADRDHLPYIHALCLEVLRWQSAVPLGLPRRLNRDDVYAGYFIPKGTVIIPNIWSLATLNIAKVKRGNTVIDPIINYTPGAIRQVI